MRRPHPIKPKAGQESVWDYPRPPALERVLQPLKIIFNGHTLAQTSKGWRVLETSHPPVYYFPVEDVDAASIEYAERTSYCEWKGQARYVHVCVDGKRADHVGWYYPDPTSNFSEMANAIAFYAAPMDAVFVGEEQATPQPGHFYGGWVTDAVVGPFKGEPGSWGW